MKLNIFILAFTSVVMFSCSNFASDSESTVNDMASVAIEGMTCEMGCAKGIEKELNATDGVSDASVNFEDKTASIHFDNSKISEEEIENIIEEMNDGQYEVDLKESKKTSNHTISSNSESEIDANSFSFEVPNLFSVLKNVL